MLKELKEPGESISFVLDFESEAESTDEDDYYGPGELRVRLDDDDITCIERAAGEVINIQRKGIAVGLRFCKDSVIVAAYEALLSQIAIDLESCKR